MGEVQYKITRQGDKTTPYIVEIVVDTNADVQEIKTDTYAPGSTIIVLEDSSVYMLSNKKEWKKL